ncbi:hypothetical protein Kisp01_69510 [Kineosporia sp. NBRC 101677]|nr:hypothetical protein Kisp01_69510 [Kineosporia sp. NBRC 101677]
MAGDDISQFICEAGRDSSIMIVEEGASLPVESVLQSTERVNPLDCVECAIGSCSRVRGHFVTDGIHCGAVTYNVGVSCVLVQTIRDVLQLRIGNSWRGKDVACSTSGG